VKPHLLGELLRLVERATRPGSPPSAELLAEIRSAQTAYEDAEFVMLAHEGRLGEAYERGAIGAPILQPEELHAVSEAWSHPREGSARSARQGGTPPPAAPPPGPSAPAQVIGGKTYRSARAPKTG
jgi:hypothetical protein